MAKTPKQESLFKSNNKKNNSKKISKKSADKSRQKVNKIKIDMNSPLANRVRPRTLDDFVGQKHLLGRGRILRSMIGRNDLSSFILWGPPGCGKTTLAEIIAHKTSSKFITFSATSASIRKVKAVMKKAEKYREQGRQTIVFIDEIHRFNKAQQDALLPYVEKGSIILIGATTENPSFSLNSALLSRCKVFVFHKLSNQDIEDMLHRVLKSKYAYPQLTLKISASNIKLIAQFANGDARKALNTLAMAVDNGKRSNHGKTVSITKDVLKQLTGKKFLLYDKHGDEHYDLISALHKSVRNSDVDSAIYWLYRMLDGGEDPIYIARRVVRMSSEDIGLADPMALTVCISAFQACKYLGMPECRLALVEAVIRLAVDPKSNAVYKAGLKAEADVKRTMNLPVPLQIRNAPTKLMNKLGYGEHYKYAHNYQYHMTSMRTMPKALVGHHYYYPTNEGLESHMRRRMGYIWDVKHYEKQHGDKKIGDFKPMDLNQFYRK